MNDLWQEGYNVGYRDGDRDGYARGWHEAMRVVNAEKPKVPKPQPDDNCPKCGVRLTNPSGYVCSSINCPIYLQTTS